MEDAGKIKRLNLPTRLPLKLEILKYLAQVIENRF